MMRRSVSSALATVIFGLLFPAMSEADLMLTTTAFSGQFTDLTDVGSSGSPTTSLPYTIPSGPSFSSDNSSDHFYYQIGLQATHYVSLTDDVTITFASNAGLHAIGFDLNTSYNHTGDYISGVSVSNGDSITGLTVSTTGNAFVGVTDTTAFNSVTLTIVAGGASYSDTITGLVTVVPEPATLVSLGLAWLISGVAGLRRRRKAQA